MVEIECRIKFTKESLRKALFSYLFRGGARGWVLLGTVIASFVFGVIFIVAGIWIGGLFVLLGIFLLLVPHITVNSMYKQFPALFEVGIACSFFEDRFIATTTSDLINSVDDMKYGALSKVTETQDCFYLHIMQMPLFVISKDGFTRGTPEDLSALFSDVLPPGKYIRQVKKR